MINKEVYYFQFRQKEKNKEGKLVSSPKGGATVCCVVAGDEDFILGIAICSPEDSFNKKLGRSIAFGRASVRMSYEDLKDKHDAKEIFSTQLFHGYEHTLEIFHHFSRKMVAEHVERLMLKRRAKITKEMNALLDQESDMKNSMYQIHNSNNKKTPTVV